jgi:hypothetical protein
MGASDDSYWGHAYTEPDDDLPASGVVSLGLGLLLAVGMVLFSGIGAILGHSLFDNVFGWGQDPLIGAACGLVIGILFAIVVIRILSGRLRRSGH